MFLSFLDVRGATLRYSAIGPPHGSDNSILSYGTGGGSMGTRKKAEPPADPPEGEPPEGGEGNQSAEDFANEWSEVKTAILDLGRALNEHLGMHHSEGTHGTNGNSDNTNQPPGTQGEGQNQQAPTPPRDGGASGNGGEQPPASTHPWYRKLW